MNHLHPKNHLLSKYPITKLVCLEDWEPVVEPYYCYAVHNEEYGDTPGMELSLRKSDLAMDANLNGYLSWWSDRQILPEDFHMSFFYAKMMDECNQKMRTAEKTVNLKDDNIIVIPLSGIYSNWNQGHDLSIIVYTHIAYLKTIEKYPNKKVYVAVNSQAAGGSRNTSDLIQILFPRDRILSMETDTLYHFPQYVSPPTHYFNLQFSRRFHHKGDVPEVSRTLDYLVDCCRNNPIYETRFKSIIDKCGGRFILFKRNTHKVARKSGIMPDFVAEALENDGWYSIDPEKLSLLEVIYLLSHTKEMILGSGGIQYAHKYFIDRGAKILTVFGGSHNYKKYNGQQEKNLGLVEKTITKDNWKQILSLILEGKV